MFLCPSDAAPAPLVGSGPVSYAFCAGSGNNGGDATNADGTFLLGPSVTLAQLTDGSSNTAAASESLLGIAGPSYTQTSPTPIPSPQSRAMAHVAAGPLTDSLCASAGKGWLLNKGAAWFDGNYLNTLYNHYLTPNSFAPDCIVYHNPGWKAARSLHPMATLPSSRTPSPRPSGVRSRRAAVVKSFRRTRFDGSNVMLRYKAGYKYVDGGVHAQVLDFPAAITCAGNLEDARRLLGIALVDVAEAAVESGQALPVPDPLAFDSEMDLDEPIYLLMQSSAGILEMPTESVS
jgi:hypothetical protein